MLGELGRIPASLSPTSRVARLVYKAFRAALSAIAFIGHFDAKLVFSHWFGWVIRNWTAFLGTLFSVIHIEVPPQNRSLFAFFVIFFGTMFFGSIADRKDANVGMTVLIGFMLLLGLGLLSLPVEPGDPEVVIGNLRLNGMWPYLLVWGIGAFGVAPRQFVWLLAFIAIFIGANEISLLLGDTSWAELLEHVLPRGS